MLALNAQRMLVTLLQEVAAEQGIRLTAFSDDWLFCLARDGVVSYVLGYDFDVNSATAKMIAKDKAATSALLAFHGVPHVPHRIFHGPQLADYVPAAGNWPEMIAYFEAHGHDVVCKPNEGTGGQGVTRVRTQPQLEAAVLQLFRVHRSICLSPFERIDAEYRVAVLAGTCEFVYRKERPALVGDGDRSVRALLAEWLAAQAELGMLHDSSSTASTRTWTWTRCPPAGRASSSTGGTTWGQGALPRLLPVGSTRDAIGKLALAATRVLGVELASVDIVDVGGDLRVLEINSGIMMESLARLSPEFRALAKGFYGRSCAGRSSAAPRAWPPGEAAKAPGGLHGPHPRAARPGHGRRAPARARVRLRRPDPVPERQALVLLGQQVQPQLGQRRAHRPGQGVCTFFLAHMGYKVPRSLTFFRESFKQRVKSARGIVAARRFAHAIGWPVYLKPLRRSQGDGVTLVTNDREFDTAVRRLFADERALQVQEAVKGGDYRIVVLDGALLSAYERIPLTVVGDGKSSVDQLLKRLQRSFDAQGRDTRIPVRDARIGDALRRARRRRTSVLPAGEALRLLDVANLSLGGTTRDVTERLHPSFARLAARVAADLDLRFAGVDVIAPDATRPLGAYAILEVNSAPGLDHYATFGPAQDRHVDALYLEVRAPSSAGRGRAHALPERARKPRKPCPGAASAPAHRLDL